MDLRTNSYLPIRIYPNLPVRIFSQSSLAERMIRMRDKNLNFIKFNIQFEKELRRNLNDFSTKFFANNVLDSPTLLEDFDLNYPRSFRMLRCLCIFQWYFPEYLHWRIFLDLREMKFAFLNEKQRIEIQLLLNSKETMLTFLYETEKYSSNEIFGNILRNDCKELFQSLKLKSRNKKVRKTQRRRGYQDHGSRKPAEKWSESYDISFTERMNEIEARRYHLNKLTNRLIKILEKIYMAKGKKS